MIVIETGEILNMSLEFPCRGQGVTVDYMNYFAHGIRFLSDPWFLAGTASPDWLSVADRKVRLRERYVIPFTESDDPRCASYASGVLQHLHDDYWFHDTVAFYEITSAVADCFRKLPEQDDGFLPGFLGHIATELLLDRMLMIQFPGIIDDYYSAMEKVSSREIESFVNEIAVRKTSHLAKFIEIFKEVQFLKDYLETRQLLKRLNQVLHRVKLQPLPDRAEFVLESAWEIIQTRGWELLPTENYPINHQDFHTTLRKTST